MQKTLVCLACKKRKPMSKFYNEKSGRHGKRQPCKTCSDAKQRIYYEKNKEKIYAYRLSWARSRPDSQRNSQLLRKYGISLEEYHALLEQQGGVCAICGRKESAVDSRWKKLRSLAVDHCHSNGHVRGLLCQKCNHGLGHFRDMPEVMIEAAYYLLEDRGNARRHNRRG